MSLIRLFVAKRYRRLSLSVKSVFVNVKSMSAVPYSVNAIGGQSVGPSITFVVINAPINSSHYYTNTPINHPLIIH